ncbi:hypothetical protein EG68_02176 [Paragonimus skrjabini miyazakii]|uniref:Protein broad-minded n=1 Tax=Paragonimus skrjabini miyazakii TaxID=59628 RepID=A0A8S9YZ82_9TREM|nr:hypothetical protein EG68_02176 [Paragonimus skrjabini miyazakii]
MYQFYRTIPYYWIRYSEKFLNDLIDRCLFVLSLSCPEAWNPTDEAYRITPICITSLLDPQADWFTKWMHGAYSRDPLICHFQKNPKLLNFSLQVFLSYLERTSTQPCTIHHKRQTSRSTSDNSSMDLSPYYSSIELEYALFLHSTNLIYRVLCHVRGRALFNNRWIPCSTQNRTPSCETTCVKQLVCAMLNYLQMDNNYASGSLSATHPVEIVAHYLSELATNSGCCSDCFGDVSQPDVGIVNDHASIAAGKRKTFTHPVDILLSELRSLCDKQTDKSNCEASRTKLDLQLRILRNLVSHKEGRHLMQLPRINEAGLLTRPVEVICKVADHALAVLNKFTLSQKEVPRSIDQLVHLLEIAQIMHAMPETTELWEPDHLYNLVVQACEIMKSCFTGDTKLRHLQKLSSSCWHRLKSIRLKLAQTTHGVAHLYKSGQLEECALDLASWIAKPTSAINKRPLGFIVSQLVCITEGFSTLKSTGLWRKQLKHAWYCVETGESSGFDDEVRSLRPSSWPVDPVDKVVFKAFIWLIRWTSSFIALREFLREQPMTSQTEDDKRRGSPVCLQDFLIRSVLACQHDGVRSLYNQEQTQLLGMRLLSCIISDLDSFLTLECRYHLVDAILQAHVDGITQSGSVLLDALSVERNYLLIKCLFVGGSTERLLPNRFLCEHSASPYPYPMLVSLDDDASLEAFDLLQEANLLTLCTQPPCESWYMTLFRTSSCTSTHPILNRVARRLNQSYPILTDSPESIQTWLSTCRSCLYEHTKGVEKTDLCSGAEVASFLEKALHSYAQPNNELHKLPMTTAEDYISSPYQVPLGDEDALGIELTVRYGQRLGLLSYSRSRYLAESEHKIALSSLLRQIRSSLFKQRDTDLASSQHSTMSVGFDWFAATIFLLFNGDVNLSWIFLSEFAADLRSVYIWHTRSQLASCSCSSGVASPFYFNGCHFLDRILALECPDVYNIFLLVELSLSQIFIRWIKQCFWNYLNWSEIVDYLFACILHPAPYCVYVVVAILRHLGESINRAKSEMPTEQEPQPEQMIVFLQEEPIRGFHLSEHMTYINELHRKYGAQLDPIFSNLDWTPK